MRSWSGRGQARTGVPPQGDYGGKCGGVARKRHALRGESHVTWMALGLQVATWAKSRYKGDPLAKLHGLLYTQDEHRGFTIEHHQCYRAPLGWIAVWSCMALLGIACSVPVVPGCVRHNGIFLGKPFSSWSYSIRMDGSLTCESPRGNRCLVSTSRSQIEDEFGPFEELGGLSGFLLPKLPVVFVKDEPKVYMFQAPEDIWLATTSYGDGLELAGTITGLAPLGAVMLIVVGASGSLSLVLRQLINTRAAHRRKKS